MTNGEKVIASFRRRLGVIEIPLGSNDDRGGWITQGEADWGMRYQPWCGTSGRRAWKDAGLSDDGLGSPSTAQIVVNARREGRLRAEPVPGCYVVWKPGPSGHVETFIRWVNKAAGQALTIGGNTSDRVREHVRDVRGAYFVVPSALDVVPQYRTLYWWEDPAAEPKCHGLWAREDYRDNAIKKWVAKNGNPGHVRKGKLSVLRGGKLVPRWTFWTGPRKRSIDFDSKAKRDADLRKVEAATGHTLRPRSRKVRVS